MGLRLKSGIDLEELRKFGFKTGKEWADAGESCLGEGHEHYHNRYYKFLMSPEDNKRIRYTLEDKDLPMAAISINPEHRSVFVDCAPSCTYHICGNELDVVTDTIFELTQAGLLEIA